jgi:hypothetical protein
LIDSATITGDKIGLTAITSNLIASGVTITSPVLITPNITTGLQLSGANGTSGQVLTSAGSGSAPTWTTVSANPFSNNTSLAQVQATALCF